MDTVSPFLLKKVIYCNVGEIDFCNFLRDGTVLIQTKDSKQAEKLKKLTKLSDDINIEISEHNTLNNCKGVVYSRDLTYLSDKEILEGLNSQGIISVRRLKKLITGRETDSGLFIVQFSSSILPDKIEIGFEKVEVRPYIPAPLKCFSCFKFGHTTLNCKIDKLCINCGNKYHTGENERCLNLMKCVNCDSTEHNSSSRNCPKYIKEKDIQSIKVLSKVSVREAVQIYNSKHPTSTGFSYSFVTAPRKNCNCKCSCSESKSTEPPESSI